MYFATYSLQVSNINSHKFKALQEKAPNLVMTLMGGNHLDLDGVINEANNMINDLKKDLISPDDGLVVTFQAKPSVVESMGSASKHFMSDEKCVEFGVEPLTEAHPEEVILYVASTDFAIARQVQAGHEFKEGESLTINIDDSDYMKISIYFSDSTKTPNTVH